MTESTVKPIEWDFESSPTTIYHNTNVVELPATETRPIMYQYDQEQFTHQEYEMYKLQQLVADLASLQLGV